MEIGFAFTAIFSSSIKHAFQDVSYLSDLDLATSKSLLTSLNTYGNYSVNKCAGNGVVIGAGPFNESISVGAGKDVLLGFDGSDVLFGGSSDDRIWGGTGNDQIGSVAKIFRLLKS